MTTTMPERMQTQETVEQEESLFESILASNPYTSSNRSEARDLAEIVASSGLYGITSPAEAFVILMTGKDLGLSESQSLRGIRVFRGVPCLSADTLHAIVEKSSACEYFKEVSTDATQSTWETKRKGYAPVQSTFTMEHAKRAGLLGKNTPWTTYPERMMKARAKAFLARDVYPDVTLGMYTDDELGDVKTRRIDEFPSSNPAADAVMLPSRLQPEDPDPWQARMRRCADAGDWSGAKQIGRDVGPEGLALYSELRGNQ